MAYYFQALGTTTQSDPFSRGNCRVFVWQNCSLQPGQKPV